MSDLKNLAQELYGLELVHKAGSLDEVQAARWQSLAQQVFARDQHEERRRSSRIAGVGKAKIQIDGESETFDVLDVSWGGLRLKGGAATKLKDGAETLLTAVQIAGEWTEINVGFAVLRSEAKGAAALRLTDLDPPRRQRFFEQAYYPMYLSHLKALAEITD